MQMVFIEKKYTKLKATRSLIYIYTCMMYLELIELVKNYKNVLHEEFAGVEIAESVIKVIISC